MTTKDNIVSFPSAAPSRQAGRLLIPERLTEARRAARMTQTELAQKVFVSRQAVSAYELGEKSPDIPVLHRLAEELRQPIAFFTMVTRPSFGRHRPNFFRKKGPDTKRRNLACSVFAEWFSGSAAVFEPFANFPMVDLPQFEPADTVGGAYSDEEVELIAERVRQHFGLGLGPISNVLRLVESKGVLACRYVLKDENVEAFSFWSGDRPFIFLSSDKGSAARARFDVAHELFHLCAHKWVSEDDLEDEKRLKQIEHEADRFAGAFLLPGKSFPLEVFSSRAESFQDLKARWKVSIQAMVYRCKDLGLFDDRQITNLYKQISYKKWRTVEPLDAGPKALQFEDPLLLRRVAEVVFQSGRYREDELKVALSLSDDVLEQMLGIKLSKSNSQIDYSPTLK